MAGQSILESALRRDRLLVIAVLGTVVALAWAYLLASAGMSVHEAGMHMAAQHAMWTPGYAALVLLMWAVMMAAMMLPSAAPMILLYGTVARRREQAEGTAVTGTGMFAFGYV